MFLLLRGFLLTSSPSLFTLNLKSAFSRVFSFRKLQIFISQTTDSHFANYRICTIPIPYFVLKFKFRQFELRLVNENNACKLAFARVGPKGIDVNGSKRLSPTPSVSNLNLRPGR